MVSSYHAIAEHLHCNVRFLSSSGILLHLNQGTALIQTLVAPNEVHKLRQRLALWQTSSDLQDAFNDFDEDCVLTLLQDKGLQEEGQLRNELSLLLLPLGR